MKFGLFIVVVLYGAQVYGTPAYYFEVPVSQELNRLLLDMGAVGDTLRPVVARSADNISKSQYTISAAVTNLDEAFVASCFSTKSLLSPLRNKITNALASPSYNLHTSVMNLLRKGIQIQQTHEKNINVPLGKALEGAIEDGTKCINQLALWVSNTLVIKTGKVAVAAQRNEQLTTFPHLLQNEMDMVLDRDQSDAKLCLANWFDKANVTIEAVKPEEPAVPPPSTDNSLAGVDITYRDGVPFVRLRVPDFLPNTLNKLGNNLGTTLFPTLDKCALSISDNRFGTAKELDTFRKYIDGDLSVARTDPVNTDLNNLNDNLSNLLQKPISELISKIVPKILQAFMPILTGAPATQSAAVAAKIVPILEEGFTKMTTCITDVSNYVTKSINSATDTAKFTCRSTGYIPARRILPGLVANIQSIADQAVEYAPICMNAYSQQTLTKFVDLQKSLQTSAIANPTAPVPAPTTTGDTGTKTPAADHAAAVPSEKPAAAAETPVANPTTESAKPAAPAAR